MSELDLDRMAAEFFGFGSWSGDICFIGPEQGMLKDESNLQARFDAWKRMGCGDLLDCNCYHKEIFEYRWHGDGRGSRIEPQDTWQKLIRTALAYRGMATDKKSVLGYQSNDWADLNGKDCVIELSGLPAHNQSVKRTYSAARLEKRIGDIQRKVNGSNFEIVLLYGQGRRNECLTAWQRFTSGSKCDQHGIFKICRCGVLSSVLAPHPTAPIRGNTYEAWAELGRKLRQMRSEQNN